VVFVHWLSRYFANSVPFVYFRGKISVAVQQHPARLPCIIGLMELVEKKIEPVRIAGIFLAYEALLNSYNFFL